MSNVSSSNAPPSASQVYSEEKQLANQRTQVHVEHEAKLRDMIGAQDREVAKTAERYEHERAEMQKSFNLQLSQESKDHEKKLNETRTNQAEEIAAVKKSKDKEFEAITVREKARMADYRKKQDENLQKLHREYSGVETAMKERNS